MNPLNILIVDDEANIRKTLSVCLESRGHGVTAVSNGRDALAETGRQFFDLAFVDLRLATESGLNLIPVLIGPCPWMKIVIITAFASIDTAAEAIRRGAIDYIPKPFTPDQVQLVTERVGAECGMEHLIVTLKGYLKRLHPEFFFTFLHPVMQRSIELARRVSPTDAVVLLRGPGGTGKNVLARAIHLLSSRADKPFEAFFCPAFSPDRVKSELFGHVRGAFAGAYREKAGRVAACEGGTLLLDEVGELPLAFQPELLRFIRDREYERLGDPRTRKADVRVIAATSTDLERAVREGRFREDLFHRLNVIPIELLPLSDRPDDVEMLANNLLAVFGKQNNKVLKGFSGEAIRAMRRYPWPDNIRELRNTVEQAAISCPSEIVQIEHLPDTIKNKR